MSEKEIRKCLREHYDEEGVYLDRLPGHDELRWIPWSINKTVDLPEALVIGTVEGRDILAYVTQKGEKPREVRYCSIPKGDASSSASLQKLPQDDVVLMKLDAPFRYNADPAKGSKRKFSVVIKWYFIARGLLDNAVSGDLVDWCKIFYNALKNVRPKRWPLPRKSTFPKIPTAQESSVDEEDSDEGEPSSSYRLRSSRRGENGDTMGGAANQSNHEEVQHTPTIQGRNADHDALRRYLKDQNMEHFLDNIPTVSGLQFYDGSITRLSLPKKLFIGRTLEHGDNIYAHLCLDGGKYVVRFWSRDLKSSGDVKWVASDIARQKIIHPFNKTYPRDSVSLIKADEERLETIITWYFIAEGAAKDVILKGDPSFNQRLKQTLVYIGGRMSPATVSEPSENSPPTSMQTPNPRPLDESHIQSSLATAVPSPAVLPSPRGVKRTAEDDAFEAISEITNQERSLTSRINAVDAELEMLEMKKDNFKEQMEIEKKNWLEQWDLRIQNFEDQWEMEHDSVLGRRENIATERQGVRSKFRRLTREDWC